MLYINFCYFYVRGLLESKGQNINKNSYTHVRLNIKVLNE